MYLAYKDINSQLLVVRVDEERINEAVKSEEEEAWSPSQGGIMGVITASHSAAAASTTVALFVAGLRLDVA